MAKTRKSRGDSAKPLTVSRPQLLIRGSDQAFRRFVHDALAFSARLQAIRNALGGVIGLSGTQYTILIAIARDQDITRDRDQKGVGINHIADQLHFSPAFVTIEVNKLVNGRLVFKKENPEDRRRVLLTTTPKAEALLRELTVVQRPVNDMLFESLSAEDFERLRHRMTSLVDSADRALQLFDFLAHNAAGLRKTASGGADI